MARFRLVLGVGFGALALVASACTQPGGGGGPVNQPPIAVPSALPSAGTAALTVAFDGTASVDNDGTITGYSWDFGDPGSGANNTSTLPTPSHTYVYAGNYTATLTVTDNLGATGSGTQPISVSGAGNPVTVTVPVNASTSNNATPTFSGTAGDNPGDAATLTVDVKQGVTTIQSLTATRTATAWSVPASGALADGTYTVEATQVLNPSGATTSPAVTFTVDTTAPVATVTAPANASTSNANTPTFTGTAGNSSGDDTTLSVVVKQGVTTVQTLSATRSGTAWSVPASGALADGTYTITATQGDAAGNSATSAANTFTVDTTAPAGVAVTAPVDLSTINTSTPTFTGTAGNAAGDSATVSVIVKQGLATLQSLTATRSGTAWSVPASFALINGAYTVTATQTDAAGNSTTSAVNTFTVSVAGPVVTITSPTDGTSTSDSTPTFSGTAGNNAGDSATVVVTVKQGVSTVQTLNATRSGTAWSITAASLSDGAYTVQATQLDGASNMGSSAVVNFTVDTAAPAGVAVVSPVSGSSGSNNTPTFSGTAGNAAGDSATVSVVVKQGVTTVQTLSATRSGTAWSVAASPALADGTYTVTATQTDAAGNSTTSATNTFTVDTVAPSGVAVVSPVDNSFTNNGLISYSGTAGTASGDGTSISVVVKQGVTTVQTLSATRSGSSWSVTSGSSLADGTYTVTAAQSDAAANTTTSAANTFTVVTTGPVVTISAPVDTSSINNATPTFSGTAGNAAGDDPTVAVVVKQGVTTVQTLSATRSGTAWSVPASGSLSDGTYTVTATQSDQASNVGSATVTFTIDTAAPTGVAVTTPASGSSTNAATPTFSGTAGNAAGDSATVSVVVKQGVTTVQTLSATRSGTAWSVPASGALADGTYTVEATQADAAGNSTTSAVNTFTVDTAAPTGVAVVSPVDGSSTNNAAPTISGTAGSASGDSTAVTVVVKQGVTTVQTLNATRTGASWSIAAASLADGTYTVTATQADAAGNSTTSAVNTFTVDTTGPSGVAVTAPANGASTNNATPTFSGTAGNAAGDSATVTVTVKQGVTTVQTLSATRSGTAWSVPASGALADGTYTVEATQSDGGGNSTTSAVNTFTVDTAAPTGVAVVSPVNGSTTNSNSPTVSGTAGNAAGDSATVTVVIKQGVTTVQTLTPTRSGTSWSAAAASLADGTYTATATQADAAGNSTTSAVNTFTVDTVGPAGVAVTAPANGSTVSTSTPTFSGTAGNAAGDSATVTVTVKQGVTTVQTLSATRSGTSWSIVASPALADGTYTVEASQADGAGNSTTSGANTFSVDTAAPSSVVGLTSGATYSSSGTLYTAPVSEGTWASPISGTASDAVSVASVGVSVRQVSSGNYWDGSSFASATEVFLPATGTTSWTFAFPQSNFPAGGQYAVRSRAVDGASNTETPAAAKTANFDYDPGAAVFVSSTGSDANNGTSTATPKLTVNGALAVADGTRNLVVVAGGSYSGQVTYTSATGVTIRGGYSSSTWFRAAPGSNTVTITGTGTGVADTGSGALRLQQLTINSGTPSGAGASAYGIRAASAGNVNVERSSVSAAAGNAGTAGASQSAATTGANGSVGNNQGDHGEAPAVSGGSGSGSGGAGGAGGRGGCGGGSCASHHTGWAGASGTDGSGGGASGGTPAGAGGDCGCYAFDFTGAPGGGGAYGATGTAGAAGANTAAADSAYGATFSPLAGGTGTAGKNGGGGAGGGGGGEGCNYTTCAGNWYQGGGGGGGGQGGTGGAPGNVGTGGGGSFGIYSFNTTVTVDANTTVTAANGGNGGNGAAGQPGGSGGSGAKGGNSDSGSGGNGGGPGGAGSTGNYSYDYGAAGSGGGGGGGGAGGNGGAGGGGAGGSSIALLAKGSGGITFGGDTNTQLTIGSGGAGGTGGSGGAGNGTAVKTKNVA